MTEAETAPATDPKQAADAFLAACSDLLLSLATNATMEARSLDALLDAMPDGDLRSGLHLALSDAGVLPNHALRLR